MTFDELREAIDALVEYNWEKERDDYEENPSDTHVFCVLVKLNNFVHANNKKPEDYIG